MNKRIEIARSIQSLGTCRIGNHQVPVENLWNNFLCGECWIRIGVNTGWRLEAGPTQVILIMLLKHMGEFATVEDVAMTMKRILETQAVLSLAYRGEEPPISESCIYCNTEANESRDNLVQFVVEEGIRYPRFWHCIDPKACQGRFAALFRGERPDPQQAVPVAQEVQ